MTCLFSPRSWTHTSLDWFWEPRDRTSPWPCHDKLTELGAMCSPCQNADDQPSETDLPQPPLSLSPWTFCPPAPWLAFLRHTCHFTLESSASGRKLQGYFMIWTIPSDKMFFSGFLRKEKIMIIPLLTAWTMPSKHSSQQWPHHYI